MAVASVFLIWFQKDKESLNAGFRYILMHIFGGCCLLAGIIIYTVSKGSIDVAILEPSPAYWLILIGFGLNTAFIPIHTWLPDAYPEGTITGCLFLSVFTTKTGVYVLARCFQGVEFVAYMGGIMAVYGVLYLHYFKMMPEDSLPTISSARWDIWWQGLEWELHRV